MEESAGNLTGNGGQPPGKPAPPAALVAKRARMWGAYTRGARTIAGLARAAKVRTSVAQKAIQAGWPEYEWPAFKDCAAAADAVVGAVVERAVDDAAADLPPDLRAAAKAAALVTLRTWDEFVTRQLAIYAKLQAALEPQAEALAAAGARVRGDGHAYDRIVPVDDGEPIRVIDGNALATASQKVTAAAKEVTTAASLLLGKPTERTEQSFADPTETELALLADGHWPDAWPPERRDAYLARLQKSTPAVH